MQVPVLPEQVVHSALGKCQVRPGHVHPGYRVSSVVLPPVSPNPDQARGQHRWLLIPGPQQRGWPQAQRARAPDTDRRHTHQQIGSRNNAIVGAQHGGTEPPHTIRAVAFHVVTERCHGALRVARDPLPAARTDLCVEWLAWKAIMPNQSSRLSISRRFRPGDDASSKSMYSLPSLCSKITNTRVGC